MLMSEEAILVYEQKQKIFKIPPNLILIFMLETCFFSNFEVFTTFSPIFTHIRCIVLPDQTFLKTFFVKKDTQNPCLALLLVTLQKPKFGPQYFLFENFFENMDIENRNFLNSV